MAKEFARPFYDSLAWKRCREEYRKYRHGLCERCLAQGLITPGRIVHHKNYITPNTVNDPSVTLNFDNLELLCWEHHEEEHKNDKRKDKGNDRYIIGADGEIIIKNSEKK